jgi:hypothetical protein
MEGTTPMSINLPIPGVASSCIPLEYLEDTLNHSSFQDNLQQSAIFMSNDQWRLYSDVDLDNCFRHWMIRIGANPLHSAYIDPGCLIRRRLTKNVPWDAYPIVSDPSWKPSGLSLHVSVLSEEDEKGKLEEAVAYISQCPIWIIRDCFYDQETWSDSKSDLLRLLGELRRSGNTQAASKGIWIWSTSRHGPNLSRIDDGQSIDIDAIKKRIRKRLPLDRFLWSYEANFMGLGAKALELANDSLHNDANLRLLSHPWAMQILFAVHRLEREQWEGKEPTVWNRAPDGSEDNLVGYPGVAVERPLEALKDKWSDYFGFSIDSEDRYTQEHQGAYLYWPGTRPNSPGLIGTAWRDGEYYGACCRALVTRGLILPPDLQAGTPARLSETGHQLLQILPPDMEDPDMLLRWRGGDEGLPKESDIPAMDRWIQDKFRKLKRRLNSWSKE